MTVGELIEQLEYFEEDTEVCIGMVQNYGTNFAMDLNDVDLLEVNVWDDGEKEMVVLTEGRQMGSVHYGE